MKSHESGRLEMEDGHVVLGNLANKTLEGELADEELCRHLVTPDLTESNSSRMITAGLHVSFSVRGRLPRNFVEMLSSRILSSDGLARGLLGSSHF